MPFLYKTGIFDYDAIIFIVINNLIKTDPYNFVEKLKKEKYGFENLFIDEAQDNDVMQNYLISLFSNENFTNVKLTIVGDKKQAIYSWRNSYPEEFDKMQKEIEEAQKTEKIGILKKSYRINNKKTLNSINNFCNKIMKKRFNSWWYDSGQDDLELAIQNNNAKDSEFYRQSENNNIEFCLNKIKEFLSNGKSAILFRSKNVLNKSGLLKHLKDLNLNYRMQIKLSEIENYGVNIQPEIAMLILILNLFLEKNMAVNTFLLLFTPSGKLILEKFEEIGKEEIFQLINNFHFDLKNYIGKLSEYTVIKNIFRFLNEKNIWELFSHEGKNLEYDKLRRIIVHILFQLLIFEKRLPEYYDKYELLLNKFENANSPYEWYSLELENKKDTANKIEVNTIHSSKGMEYDNVIVLANISKMLSEEFFTNLNMHGDRYEAMFNIKFEKVLTNNPEIKYNFFPYLGTKTAKILAKILKEGKDNYLMEDFLNIKNSIINETMNLLYVAITRSRKNILLIDCVNPKKNLIHEISELGLDICFDENNENSKNSENNDIFFPQRLSKDENNELIKINEGLERISVRNYIKNKYDIKYTKATSDLREKYEWTKIGTALHFFVEFLLKNKNNIKDINDIDKILEMFNNKNLTNEQKKAIEIIKNEKNKERKERIYYLCKNYEKFKNEVKIIGYKDNNYIIGAIDTLGINQNKYILIEYKVTFKEEELLNKRKEGFKQLETYNDLFINLENNLDLEKPIAIIFDGEDYGN